MQFFTPSITVYGKCCRRRDYCFSKGNIYEVLAVAKDHWEVAHPRTRNPVYIILSPWNRKRMTLTPLELDLANLFK